MEPSLSDPVVWIGAFEDAFADPVMIAFVVIVAVLVIVGIVGNVVLSFQQRSRD